MSHSVEVIGVRHHSPACANLVRTTIERTKPQFVLIEGPADFNSRIDELKLDHDPPVAIFSYHQEKLEYHRSFCPFCAYSPEWVALQTAKELKLDCYFMDLPSWTRAFAKIENRYHDTDRSRDYVERLYQKLGLQGMDELWDHLFEQPQETDQLSEKLSTYFQNLRESSVPSDSDLEREDFMAQFISWAAQQGDVVAVCGGFHKPALEALWPKAPKDQPEVPLRETGRFGSFLVPYSFHRLDSFTGYEAGMPSPNFYQLIWQHGPAQGVEEALKCVVERLRQRKLSLSAADLIACQTMTEGLQGLRGHNSPSRNDLLDGLASSLLKHGLERPLPWTVRGPLPADTDPILAEMMIALSGRKVGTLDQATPLPPLVSYVREKLNQLELSPSRQERDVQVEIGEEKSHVLHQLGLLRIPGFRKLKEELGVEHWGLLQAPDFDSALIEAGALGATLEEAAFAKLQEDVQAAEGFTDQLAELLVKAYRAGLRELPERLLAALRKQATSETDHVALGAAVGSVLSLWRSFPEDTLKSLTEECCQRLLWLVELVSGPHQAIRTEELKVFANLKDCYRIMDLDWEPAIDVFRRRASESTAPPAHRGASLGFLWSAPIEHPLEDTLQCLRDCSQPKLLGDLLAGLFAVARQIVVSEESLTLSVDQVLSNFSEQEFLIALPSLRLAYSFFPPREREAIATHVLRAKGLAENRSWQLVEELQSPEIVAHNMSRERELEDFLVQMGLGS